MRLMAVLRIDLLAGRDQPLDLGGVAFGGCGMQAAIGARARRRLAGFARRRAGRTARRDEDKQRMAAKSRHGPTLRGHWSGVGITRRWWKAFASQRSCGPWTRAGRWRPDLGVRRGCTQSSRARLLAAGRRAPCRGDRPCPRSSGTGVALEAGKPRLGAITTRCNGAAAP